METQYMVAISDAPDFKSLPAVQTMNNFISLLQEGNIDEAKGLLSDDIVMTLRGKSLISGEHKTPNGVIALLKKMSDLSNGTHKIVGTLAWMVHENHIHTVVAETAVRNGKAFTYNRALVFEVLNGKITMGQSFEDDQYAFDEFWS